MNFMIVGPGAMGCLFAARLKSTGFKVTILDYKQDRADILNKNGIHIEGISGNHTIKVPVITERPDEKTDLVLICVKSNETRKAAESISSRTNPNTWVLTLQNGLGNFEALEDIIGKGRVIGGVTSEGGTLLGPGHVRHAGKGETVIGPESLPGCPIHDITSSFNKAGFKARSVEDVHSLIWGKLIVNVGINALTAITRLNNGRLPEIEGTNSIMEEAVLEAVAVANSKGITLPYPDPIERVKEVCSATAANVASMLQDVLNMRITEVAFINGAIVREGMKNRIATPVNHTLTRLVEAIQTTYGDTVSG
ncbi:ketopantoate reductase family protein [Thermodesulfobacteriota bacterium]